MAVRNVLLAKSGTKQALDIGFCAEKKLCPTYRNLLQLLEGSTALTGRLSSRPSVRRDQAFICGALHLLHRDSPAVLSRVRELEQSTLLTASGDSQVLALENLSRSKRSTRGLGATLQVGLEDPRADGAQVCDKISGANYVSSEIPVKAKRKSSRVGSKRRGARTKMDVEEDNRKHLVSVDDVSSGAVEQPWQAELADRVPLGGDSGGASTSRQYSPSWTEAEIKHIERSLSSLKGAMSLQEAYSSSLQHGRKEGSETALRTGPEPQRKRLTLKARVALKQQRIGKQGREGGGGDDCAQNNLDQRGDGPTLDSAAVSREDRMGLQVVDEEEELLHKYGAAAQLVIGDWERIERHRLLGYVEERWLAEQIVPFKNLEKVRKRLEAKLQRMPTEREWAAAADMQTPVLRRKLALGEAARNKLVMHNLRLVTWMASRFSKMSRSLEYSDLCQQGIMGLIEGAASFDPSRGLRFSTYITFWVRTAIMRFITKHGNTLRAPISMGVEKLNISRARSALTHELGRPVKDAEIIERLRMREDRFRAIRAVFRPVSSLNVPHRSTGVELVHSVVGGRDGTDMMSLDARLKTDPLLRIDLDDVLDSLKPRESLVLRQRFGLDGRGFKSQVEIGRNLNISKQMVNKYQDRALNKMRHPERLEHLRKFLSVSS